MHAFHFHAFRDSSSHHDLRGECPALENGLFFADGWRFELEGDWRKETSSSGQVRLVCGEWPDPPGLVLEQSENVWRLVSDHASIATIFVDERSPVSSKPSVSTSFKDLIAGSTIEIMANGIEEIVLIGHVLGNGTMVKGIHRVRQGSAVEFLPDGAIREVGDERSDPSAIAGDIDAFKELPSGTAFTRSTETSIELTGGLDSRLTLAMFLAAGELPGSAITFGSSTDPDVRIASAIASELGIGHHRLDGKVEGVKSVLDAEDHVLATGGLLNLGRYSGLMRGISLAAGWRCRQASGLGGELGMNFYSIPGIDWATGHENLNPVVNRRIIQTPPGLIPVARGGISDAVSRVSKEVMHSIQSMHGDAYEKLRHFYIRERMANWGFAGLNANRYQYDLSLPLLSRQYLAWSNALSNAERHGRVGQEKLLASLTAGLEKGDLVRHHARSSSSRGVGRILRLGRKLLAKAIFKIDPRPDSDSRAVLDIALETEHLRDGIQSVGELRLFGQRFTTEDLKSLGSSTGSLVGMCLTVAAIQAAAARPARW